MTHTPEHTQSALDALQRTCLRCGHTWTLRTPKKPKVCPKCKNVKWNVPRRTRSTLLDGKQMSPLQKRLQERFDKLLAGRDGKAIEKLLNMVELFAPPVATPAGTDDPQK